VLQCACLGVLQCVAVRGIIPTAARGLHILSHVESESVGTTARLCDCVCLCVCWGGGEERGNLLRWVSRSDDRYKRDL